MRKNFKRFACLFLTAVFGATFSAGNILAFADNGTESPSQVEKYETADIENVTGKVDLSGITLKNLAPSVLENTDNYEVKDEERTLIVTLDKKTVLDYLPDGEEISDYLASYGGKKAARAVSETQTELLNAIHAKKIGYSLVYQYKTVTNAVAIKVNTKYISAIKTIPSVKSVVVSETYSAPAEVTAEDGATNDTLSNVYKTGIYNSSEYKDKADGSGMTVAVLDTGLDYTHPAFSTDRFTSTNPKMTKDYVADKTVGANVLNAVTLSANNGQTVTADDLYISPKIPFAYDYADKDADVYPSYSQHGTHVAGIVGGNDTSYKDKDGHIVEEPFYGVAPNAQLVICKVFTDDFESDNLGGAVAEDIVAALEDCVNLGVDIINMSLGTTAGFSTKYIDGDDEGTMLANVYANIKKAGISLICAASNDFSSGYGSAFGTNRSDAPDSGTVGSPSTFVGALSVASINGQLSPYMMSNGNRVYFQDASDANGVRQDFIKDMLGEKGATGSVDKATFKYVVIGGTGNAGNYTGDVLREVEASHAAGQKVIALVSRGSLTFKDKVLEAMDKNFDAIIIHNNVAGTVGMTYGDIKNPIPAITITMDAGNMLRYETTASGGLRERLTGEITLDRSYEAGPFMNDYSSWGATPDLKLKPEITSHGGEITSTVSGGYAEMSGTSMATPNLAGFTALLRSYLDTNYKTYIEQTMGSGANAYNTRLNQLINQIMMSTAKTVYDQNELPYSPRKQGAGLATLDNVFSTSAYCWTDEANGGAEDNRPKIELGYDKNCNGVQDAKSTFENLTFKVTNFGTEPLKFKTKAIFMTETLSSDGLAVAEKAYILDDNPAQWKLARNGGNPAAIAEGTEFEVAAGETVTLSVTLSLSDAEKNYIQTSFENGMYVEGFLKLVSASEGQCDLTVPFMGFYGNWKKAPLLDYDCYEISDFQKDSQYTDETRPQPRVWATQMYLKYYDNKYSIPMGGFAYIQDENADQIYTEREHASISCYNLYNGEGELSNYMTTTEIRGLYTGLLRNCEIVTYDMYDDETGELISADNCVYTIEKAYASAGSARPANVEMKLNPYDMGLKANGKYRLDYKFFFEYEDYEKYKDGTFAIDPENTVSMSFYVDYEAPVLQQSRIRYFDYKDGNKDKQRIYLDLDIFDNHYPQAVVLCYAKQENDMTSLDMATRYATPVYNAVKNGTTTVSIEITDIYEQYGNRLYVQLDDYALNHSVWSISRGDSNDVQLPDSFEINGQKEITIGVNQTAKLTLNYEGGANASNFEWASSRDRIVRVKNGEIFGVRPGTADITVRGKDGASQSVKVTVVESNTVLTTPNVSFGTVVGANGNLVKAQGSVDVNAGQAFKLDIITDPWYYFYSSAYEKLKLKWTSTDPTVATVDQQGNVTTLEKWGSTSISATIMDGEHETAYAATVTLNVQEPFTISNYTLTKYHGWGGELIGGKRVLKVDDDKNIMYIGEDAFEDNTNVEVIILPKTVVQINEYAFRNCTSLKEVYFISQEKIEPANAALSIIMRRAFYGCSSLEKVDLSNCKTITVGEEAFWSKASRNVNGIMTETQGCVNLKKVVAMENIGTMGNRAFAGTALEEADISGLHTAGIDVFAGCASLKKVNTDFYSALGDGIFRNCTALQSVEINAPAVGARAFKGCTELSTVTFNPSLSFSLGDEAFSGCSKLATVTNYANIVKVGDQSFTGTPYFNNLSGAVYANGGKTLVLAPSVITGDGFLSGVTEIAPYAFSSSRLGSGVTKLNLTGVEKIGEGAFAHLGITELVIPSTVKEIAPHAFEDTALGTVEIAAGVTYIGNYAFAGCTSLTSVTFAANSQLAAMGDGVFAGCTSLTAINLPENLTEMGGQTFSGCTSLVTINLPALKALGMGTFTGCTKLTTVTFAEGASTTGTFTFGGTALSGNNVVFRGCPALTSVTLGKNVKEIGAYAFAGCTALEELDINGATTVGIYAFGGCTALEKLTGLDKIVIIGQGAFIDCSKLADLTLNSAIYVGSVAFVGVGFTSLNLDSVISIGAEAFLDGRTTEVRLPASLAEIGDAAFVRSPVLRSFVVDANNKIFFAEDGVLYRYLTGRKDAFELCAYPSARVVALEDGLRTYEIKEGTVSVQGYAFAELNDNTVSKVKLPYSVKVIGSGAFNSSGIIEFHFESINAPVLLTEAAYNETTDFYNLYYNNFNDYFLDHYSPTEGPVTGGVTLRIHKPSNGLGYDNLIFSNYFSSVVELGELIEDSTRSLKAMIESEDFYSVETVRGWLNLPVTADNTKTVSDFSETVKEAHRIYNSIRSEKQLELLGSENAEKLFAIEAELKPVKQKFNIPFRATSLSISSDSTYKTQYAAGERFNPSGLVIIVTYDDYSTEIADTTQVTLSSSYDRELNILDRYVEYYGYGLRLRVPVTVTEGGNGGDGEGGVNPAAIYGPIIGVVVVAAAVAVTLILLKKKKGVAPATEAAAEPAITADDDETKPTDKTEK